VYVHILSELIERDGTEHTRLLDHAFLNYNSGNAKEGYLASKLACRKTYDARVRSTLNRLLLILSGSSAGIIDCRTNHIRKAIRRPIGAGDTSLVPGPPAVFVPQVGTFGWIR
jgi:hypothetical protein